MSQIHKINLEQLELASGFEKAGQHSNGNGITGKNGHSKNSNGKAGLAGPLLNQLKIVFENGDPFPLGLAPINGEFRTAFKFTAKIAPTTAPLNGTAGPVVNHDIPNPESLFAETRLMEPAHTSSQGLHYAEYGKTNESVDSTPIVTRIPFTSENAFLPEQALTANDNSTNFGELEMPLDAIHSAAQDKHENLSKEHVQGFETLAAQLDLPKLFQTEPFHGEIEDPKTGSPYRTSWLTIPKDGPLFPFDGVDPRVAEQYRILRTGILLHQSKPKVIAISSGSSGDGKTLTAINFAGILAMKDEVKVLIVEADLRKGSLAPTLGIETSPGLAEVLSGKASLEMAIVSAGQLPNLHILTGGDVKVNPAELLDSTQFRQFVEDVRQKFTYVVFDTTPAASVADFKIVMQVCDGVLMVVRPEHTDRPAFQRAFELIPEKKLLGAVINAFEDWFLWNKMDSNYYYSGEPRAASKPQPFFRWRRRTPQNQERRRSTVSSPLKSR